jgi:hypothetical protein
VVLAMELLDAPFGFPKESANLAGQGKTVGRQTQIYKANSTTLS